MRAPVHAYLYGKPVDHIDSKCFALSRIQQGAGGLSVDKVHSPGETI